MELQHEADTTQARGATRSETPSPSQAGLVEIAQPVPVVPAACSTLKISETSAAIDMGISEPLSWHFTWSRPHPLWCTPLGEQHHRDPPGYSNLGHRVGARPRFNLRDRPQGALNRRTLHRGE